MKQIKLVGREIAILRAIESAGSTGQYIHERTSIDAGDVLDTLNGLADVGYVEAYVDDGELPTPKHVTPEQFAECRFEINPAYYLELKKVMKKD